MACFHMLFGGSYRKPIPGVDPATFRFLNRVFAADARHVYALMDLGLTICEGLDPAKVRPQGAYAMVSQKTRFHVSADALHATPASEEG